MYRLVVLFVAMAALAEAKPGYLHGAVVPVATSHSSRIDYHSKPIAIVAPVVKPIIAAPIVKYVAPAIAHAPLVTSTYHGWNGYGYGGYGHGYGHGYGLGYGYGHGLGYGHGHGHGAYGHYW